jgi:hypothetical protein
MHQQLRAFWHVHPMLRKYVTPHSVSGTTDGVMPYPVSPAHRGPVVAEMMAAKYGRGGYRFLPLIGAVFGHGYETACALDVLFLRRDQPGDIVQSGGDIDNRIKVLFDALRMPQSDAEISGFAPMPGEDPFFCLLEDDRLITDVRLTTDRLLTPLGEGQHKHDVHLVIQVKTLVIGTTQDELHASSPLAAFIT